MSEPLNFTTQILTVADDVRRQGQALRGIAEQVQGLGRQVEGTSAGEMATQFVANVGAWIRDFDAMDTVNQGWARASEETYYNAKATDRRGRDLLA